MQKRHVGFGERAVEYRDVVHQEAATFVQGITAETQSGDI